MGIISTKDLLYMIDKILITNYPITLDDLKSNNDILEASLKALKDKTLRNQESMSDYRYI